MLGPLLKVQMWFCVAGARDSAPCQKWAKREGFVAFPKNDDRRGAFAEYLERCISRGRRGKRDMFIRDVRRSGRWFPESSCIFEHQIFSFGKMIWCDSCSALRDLASLLRGRRNTSEKWTGKSQNVLVRGRQLCTQLSIFEGGLAELLRFCCCQLRESRKCRRKIDRQLQLHPPLHYTITTATNRNKLRYIALH